MKLRIFLFVVLTLLIMFNVNAASTERLVPESLNEEARVELRKILPPAGVSAFDNRYTKDGKPIPVSELRPAIKAFLNDLESLNIPTAPAKATLFRVFRNVRS